jgi:hypothetical protein
MVSSRSGASYDVDATDHGRLARQKSRLVANRKAVASGKKKITRHTEQSVTTPPELKRKRAEIEEEKLRRENEGKKKTTTRSSGTATRCTNYGVYRHAQYKEYGFFFCSPCDLYDSVVEKWRVDSNCRTYKCVAGHNSFIFPSTKTKTYLPSKQVDFSSKKKHAESPSSADDSEEVWSSGEEDEDEEEEEDTTPPPLIERSLHSEFSPEADSSSDPVSTYQLEIPTYAAEDGGTYFDIICSLQAEIADLKTELQFVKENKSGTPGTGATGTNQKGKKKKKKQTKKEVNDALEEALSKSIMEVLAHADFSNLGLKRTSAALVKCFWNVDDGHAQGGLIGEVSKWLRNNIFTPGKVLKGMDMHGGTLNYEGIEILRMLETLGRKYFRYSILPSTSRIQRFQRKMNKVGESIAPFKSIITEDGEGIEFDPKAAVELVFHGYGLTETGKTTRLNCGVSCDGTNMSKKINTMIGGFKVNHITAVCPIRKLPIFCETGTGNSCTGIQSHFNCFPTNLYIGKETKKSFQRHKPQFDWFNTTELDGPENPFYSKWLPFKVSVELDMKGSWEGTLIGGPAKIEHLPCQQCAIISDDLHVPKPMFEKCGRWCQALHLEKEGWQCYHHEMISPDMLENMGTQVEALRNLLSVTVDEITTESKMRFENPDRLKPNSETYHKSIGFIPNNHAEKTQFSALLTKELMLRSLPTDGDIVIRRERLRDSLRREYELRNLLKKIDHGTPQENALFLVMQSIPCILHCANRVNLKILTVLLCEGLSNAKKGQVLSEFPSEGRRIDEFLLGIERIVNTSILGKLEDPSQWRVPTNLPTSKLATEIGIICMVNDKSVKIVDYLEELILYCIPEENDTAEPIEPNRRSKWLRCIPKYRSAMLKLRQHNDFTDSDISEFQNDFDIFFQDWIQLHGKIGVTNYIHMLAAGHISDYLYKWRNLYKHSQQGWESLNNLIKSFWFRRTGRGGATGAGKGKKSKLNSVAKWLQRRMMWVGGWEEDTILAEWEKQNNAARDEITVEVADVLSPVAGVSL